MAKYAERGGLTQSRHDFTTPMPSETGFASNFKPENIVSDDKIVNNMDKIAYHVRISPQLIQGKTVPPDNRFRRHRFHLYAAVIK
ncbi:TPA: hypothetical protein ACFU4X_000155 [Neisseria meningitidis]|uniref:hypothetical protein n=1 Tax=Neisseria polysaccharea TaxID=489 RepID=UPI0027E062DD|nr:hypothetical protein [Neisseria polysaccharea]